MSRRTKPQRRIWARWVEWHQEELLSCGIPRTVFENAERWDHFVYDGYVSDAPHQLLFTLDWLSHAQLRLLRRFLEREHRDAYAPPLLRMLRERVSDPGEIGRTTALGDAITEGAWLTSSDPELMFPQVRQNRNRRKLRLFALACSQRVLDGVRGFNSRRERDTFERCADGVGANEELSQTLGNTARFAWTNPESARSAAAAAAVRPKVEEGHQADLLRDIFGNLFRTVSIDPSWLQGNEGLAGRIAQTIYDEGRFSEMPILGDALAEAGCQDRVILDHCRRIRGHVRGCWVLDSLLGAPLFNDLGSGRRRFWSIKQAVEEEGRLIRRTSCAGGYACVTLRLEPIEGTRPILFVNAAGESAGPWLPSVETGILQFSQEQAQAGIHLRGIRATLTTMQAHPVDSNHKAFERATLLALQQAMDRAGLTGCA